MSSNPESLQRRFGAGPLGPKPLLGYTRSALDRAAVHRLDPAWLKQALGDPRTRVYLLGGERIALKPGGGSPDPLFTPAEARALAPEAESVFLGTEDGAARFGMGLGPEALTAIEGRGDLLVEDLRGLAAQGWIAARHLPPLAEAKALLHWHARRHFCSNCGGRTVSTEAGWKRVCPTCKAEHFPRTDPVVIMLIVHGDRTLLGRSGRFAAGMWSCLAGFVEPGETIEDAVARETMEEAGIRCGRVQYVYSQPWPFPSSLMIGCRAEALDDRLTMDTSELVDLRWFSRDECAAMLARRHSGGLTAPQPIAIAHHLIRDWVEGGHALA